MAKDTFSDCEFRVVFVLKHIPRGKLFNRTNANNWMLRRKSCRHEKVLITRSEIHLQLRNEEDWRYKRSMAKEQTNALRETNRATKGIQVFDENITNLCALKANYGRGHF